MNLRQFAAHLGLSPTTVSRAINGFPEVNEATRQRVMAAVTELGYRPNPVARQLATGKTGQIGIIYPFLPSDLGDPVFLDIIAGITETLAESEMDLVIISASPSGEMDSYRRVVTQGRVDGLIVPRTRVKDERLKFLLQRDFPFVAHGRSQLSKPYPWFDYDNEAGMRLAVRELLALGHRRIALIHAEQDMNFAQQRLAGYLAEMHNAGLKPEASDIVFGGLSPQQGAAAVQTLLEQSPYPSAIIVDNNVAGAGVVAALNEAHHKIGHHLSLVVFGGLPQHHANELKVSAIIQPEPHRAGQTLAKLMLERVGNKPVTSLQTLWQPIFSPGDTVIPPLLNEVRSRR